MPERIMDMDKWGSIDWDNKEHKKKVIGALSYYLNAPNRMAESQNAKVRAMVQEFTTTGDFPLTNLINTVKSFQTQVHYDTGYQEIFDVFDFKNSRQNGFDVEDMTDGLTFALKLPGEKIDVFTMSGTKSRVYFNYYGGGLGWHINMIHDEEYWKMENTAKAFRNKAYSQKAQTHYAMMEAIGVAQNIAWQPHPDGVVPGVLGMNAGRDTATINAACLNIIQNCKNKGYAIGNPMDTVFKVVAPLELAQRINNAMKFHIQQFDGSPNQTVYRWEPVMTDMFVARNAYYVCLPKEKNITGDRWDLTLFEDFDINTLLTTAAGWHRWGAVIGDQQQWQRCAIA